METILELLTANFGGKATLQTLNGRQYLVAPMTLIVPGVLTGSKGALYYPPEEVARDVSIWNGMPITLGHPVMNGEGVSARSPGVSQLYELGTVYNARIENGKLMADGWFDVEFTKRKDVRIYNWLQQGQSFELSTGLFTQNFPVQNGVAPDGRAYAFVARNYKADHLAVLPDQVGACSRRDGCGVLVGNVCEVCLREPTANARVLGDGAKKLVDAKDCADDVHKGTKGKKDINGDLDHDEMTANLWGQAARAAAALAKRSGRAGGKAIGHSVVGRFFGQLHKDFKDAGHELAGSGAGRALKAGVGKAKTGLGKAKAAHARVKATLQKVKGSPRRAVRALKLRQRKLERKLDRIGRSEGFVKKPKKKGVVANARDYLRGYYDAVTLNATSLSLGAPPDPNGVLKKPKPASAVGSADAKTDLEDYNDVVKKPVKNTILRTETDEHGHAFTTNAKDLCVNCGGPGGTPGPCPHSGTHDARMQAIFKSQEAVGASHAANRTYRNEETESRASTARKLAYRASSIGAGKSAAKPSSGVPGRAFHHENAARAHDKAASAHEKAASLATATSAGVETHYGKAHSEAATKHREAAGLHRHAAVKLQLIGNVMDPIVNANPQGVNQYTHGVKVKINMPGHKMHGLEGEVMSGAEAPYARVKVKGGEHHDNYGRDADKSVHFFHSGNLVANDSSISSTENVMKLTDSERTGIVTFLTTNCNCWKGKEKVLNGMEDDVLTNLKTQTEVATRNALIVNAVKTELKLGDDVTASGIAAAVKAGTTVKVDNTTAQPKVATLNELLAAASPEDRAAWDYLQNSKNEATGRLKAEITELANNAGDAKDLILNDLKEAKDVKALEKLAVYARTIAGVTTNTQTQTRPLYIGAGGGPTTNSGTKVDNSKFPKLERPTTDWETVRNEQRANDRRKAPTA